MEDVEARQNAGAASAQSPPKRPRRRKRQREEAKAPGVILLQIDGLSRFQFERALKAGRMTFLQSLIEKQPYSLCSFYPGQPSSTPAVQAEIMYGKPCAVPAFSFYDAEKDADFRMYDADWATRVSELASRSAAPLLSGGGSYGNIYSGGAERAEYCGENNTFAYWLKEASIFRLAGLALRYPKSAVKVVSLCLIEVFIALFDFVKGVIRRGDVWAELKFIGARVGVSIALREAIRFRVSEDVKDGLPIIHANFFGYDEQAHRRGPQSLFAHWCLKGIDGVVKKIFRVARKKGGRDYRIIVFSDHGQETVSPYDEEFGLTLEEKVQEMFHDQGFWVKGAGPLSNIMERAKHAVKSAVGLEGRTSFEEARRWIRVKAMGPVGHIYVQQGLSESSRRDWALRFVREAGICVALYRNVLGDTRCVFEDEEGDLILLEDALEKRGHAFAEQVVADLDLMVKSGLSGDLVLLGWRPNQKPLSFAEERGAHGGPGAEESHGFALLPRGEAKERQWIRGLDLREIAMSLCGRCLLEAPVFRDHAEDEDSRVLQVATYNVHGGVGTDRRLDAERIADVVSRLHVDVVCFQEAFCSLDQVISLEAALRERWSKDLYYDFLPLHTRRGFRYGLAIASLLPMKVVKSAGFDLADRRFARREPRGAQLAELRVAGQRVLVANTHFGLNAAERLAQAQRLLADDWLGNGQTDTPVTLVGDFNAGPSAPPIRLLRERFSDAQESVNRRSPQASFLSWAPIRRIDHILASPHWKVKQAGVFRGRDARAASDHLPVFADLTLVEGEKEER